eukprot:CAMPEP_0171310020 /NCGR_PEP_ID=MMETSP0816-20121228/20222_1 /TAXON_ID=420281 /ORGANISM="Proboscia inermis, Strain CCAP1064/1" /LENGTH=71 /DNA_ID=CAMNT_0011793929 /DNA_START=2189 /DNA_END=2404 /DNA_ORIENTATION=-
MSHYFLPNGKKERHTKEDGGGGGDSGERQFSHPDGWDCDESGSIVSHGSDRGRELVGIVPLRNRLMRQWSP